MPHPALARRRVQRGNGRRELLIERGAEIDPRDDNHGTTPIYWAYWGRRPQCVDLLAPHSQRRVGLGRAGKLDRLREVIAAEPQLAASRDEHDTVLFYLPDDENVRPRS